MAEFIHLHNHSHYSLLDGAATVDSLINAAIENKMPAVALTDHGVMFGTVEFFKKAKSAGLKPIIGCEFYIVTYGSRFDKVVDSKRVKEGKGRGIYQHLVLLAKNLEGYRNLSKLSTLSHLEGFYYKPRIDLELLRKYSSGLIALSACPAGVVASEIVDGKTDLAFKTAKIYKEIFKDDFYLELQDHGLEKEKPILENMPRIAKELGIKLVATNDIHYIKARHAIAHNVLLLIPEASGSSPVDYKQLKYKTDQLYFKSTDEMCLLFKDFPEAIKSTLEICAKIENFSILPSEPYLPKFVIPADSGADTFDDYLDKLAFEGLQKKYKTVTAEIEQRLKHELSVIKEMKYSGYFLVVQDFINEARRMGILVGPGRGSAAGSLVSYALGIIGIDPLKYDLLFERFLNPDRVSMPDIDVDFADDKRDLVIKYVKDKYGEKAVAQIITFGTLSSKAVLKDVGRVLGIELSLIESITKLIPSIQGKVLDLDEALTTVPDLKWVKESKDPKIKELIEISLVLQGMNRNASMHASGVVIAPGDISDYVPLYATPQSQPMTQFYMNDLESVGLLKMDFLGLRTLTIIDNALKLIRDNHGVEIDINSIPEDDQKVFELFQKGNTTGIFQFESTGMQESLRKLKPSSINELVAMNALYRPGPMEMIDNFIKQKQGVQKIQYLHPKLEPILKETYGVIVYQEQVMKITSEIAGFTLAKADIMRRAMGKKDKDLMAKQKDEFIDGAVKKGFTKKIAGDIFDMVEKFASYGFNKSHSVAYAVIAYKTAYLKTYYPAEYLSAMMSAEIGDTDYIVQLIEDARRLGIKVLPPDVNESVVNFAVTKNGIRFGLSAIKNVGVGAVENIIKARKNKNFTNIFDFCSRVDLRTVNKKTLEGLTMAGALDSFTGHRAQIFETIEKAIQFGQKQQSYESRGQSTLFATDRVKETAIEYPALPEVEPWSEIDKLTNEKKVLGFYVSGHPLSKYELEATAFSTVNFNESIDVRNGAPIKACGIISAIKKTVDRNGKMMAFVTLENFSGKGEVIVFSKIYEKVAPLLQLDAILMVIGRADTAGDRIKILADEFIPIEQARERFTKTVIISIDANKAEKNVVDKLQKILEKHKGKCSVLVEVNGLEESSPQVFRIDNRFRVAPTDDFFENIYGMFGKGSIRISG
ncbi:MAG: DNA polymerase III subunit alpha [Bacteroidetes bacterium]|nr:DNA polymerase III subunit alpha [Bacteroidota bacterium]